MNGRADCLVRDGADPLAPLRDQFALERVDERGIIYFDGNSLGVLPRKTAARVREVVETEWGGGLITSWNLAGWITLSRRIGAKIAPLIGAAADEVDDGRVRDGHVHGVARQAAGELGQQDVEHGRRARLLRDDVLGGRPSAPLVLRRHVRETVGARVGVHGREDRAAVAEGRARRARERPGSDRL